MLLNLDSIESETIGAALTITNEKLPVGAEIAERPELDIVGTCSAELLTYG